MEEFKFTFDDDCGWDDVIIDAEHILEAVQVINANVYSIKRVERLNSDKTNPPETPEPKNR